MSIGSSSNVLSSPSLRPSLEPSVGPDAKEISNLAHTGTLDELVSFLVDHPEFKDALDDALVAESRYGDVFALAQSERRAAQPAPAKTGIARSARHGVKTVDFDTPVWNTTRFGNGPSYPLRQAGDHA